MMKKTCPERSRRVYLDYAATTPTRPEVVKAIQPYWTKEFGNPSSVHSWGQEARKTVEKARAQIAKILNCSPQEVFFTGTNTISDNLAIQGVVKALQEKNKVKKLHLITSQIEHHAVLDVFKVLEKQGLEVIFLPVNKDGLVDAKKAKNTIKENTVLASIMYASNEVGTIQPIREIGHTISQINKLRMDNGELKIYFHTDAAAVVDYLDIDVKKLGVDLMTIGAHKFGGPKGMGVLYVKKGVEIEPLTFGGHHERGLYPGTEAVPLIVGMAKALELADKERKKAVEKVTKLRDRLIEGVLKSVPDSQLTGHPTKRLPDIASFIIKGVEGEAMLLHLDREGVAASSGSACTSGILEPSHVLTAMGYKPREAHGSLRFSLGKQTTEEEIDYVIKVLPGIIEKLRKMAPKGILDG